MFHYTYEKQRKHNFLFQKINSARQRALKLWKKKNNIIACEGLWAYGSSCYRKDIIVFKKEKFWTQPNEKAKLSQKTLKKSLF